MRKRGFEIISEYLDKSINLPVRKTKYSAGYDVEAAEDIVVEPFVKGMKPVLIKTGIKAYCQEDEYIMLVNRSSGPMKKGLVVTNGIGIIDGDYYNNPDNEGHIMFQVINIKDEPITINKGDAIGQLIFQKFMVADSDEADGERTGGFGSTDK